MSRHSIIAAAAIVAGGFIGLAACDGETPTAVSGAAEHDHAGTPLEVMQYRMGLELFERGDPRAAERYLLSLYPYDWAVYVPAQYHLGRVYEELDQPDRAREHYRIFVEWWETADAALQPWVDEGRAALARLNDG